MELILVSEDEEITVLHDVEDHMEHYSKQKLGIMLADQLVRSFRMMQVRQQDEE